MYTNFAMHSPTKCNESNHLAKKAQVKFSLSDMLAYMMDMFRLKIQLKTKFLGDRDTILEVMINVPVDSERASASITGVICVEGTNIFVLFGNRDLF